MKKKIFHIIPTLASGGAERQLVDVVSNTSGEEFEHTVCVLGKPDFFAPVLRQKGHEIIELNIGGKYPWLAAARRILPVVRQKSPDLIHSWLFDAHITARLIKLSGQKIPLLASVQNPDYEPETVKAGNWSPGKINILRLMDKFSAKLTKPQFVACSQFVAVSYRKQLGLNESQMSVIYNSVDPQTLACASGEPEKLRQSLGIPADAFVYLNIGRLDPQKGQVYLLKAFRRVLVEVPHAFLVIVGTGRLETSLKELAKSLKIEDRVFFSGRRKDIGACLEMSDVFVFPSLFEGFGIVLVEAMSKGLACIASRIGVLKEVVDDKTSALMIAPKSESELAEAMILLFKEPAMREKLGREARLKVRNQFLSEALMPEWEKLYAELSA